jgi:putative transposase
VIDLYPIISIMLRIRRAHAFTLQLSNTQRAALGRMADARRTAYNVALALDRDLYAADLAPADFDWLRDDELPDVAWRRSLTPWDLSKIWPRYWHEAAAFAAPGAGRPAQIAFADYTNARDAAVARIKAGDRRINLPRFRSHFDPHQGFSVDGRMSVVGDAIKIPNAPIPLRVAGSTRRLRWFLANRQGTIQQAHLVRDSLHRPWRCVVVIEIDAPESELREPDIRIGLDLGLTHFAVLSTGEQIDNPRVLQQALKRLRRVQQSVSRSEQDRQKRELVERAAGRLGAHERLSKSVRHLAKEAVVSRLHIRVAAVRAEFHHGLAKRLVADYPVIGVEKLAVRNLVQNRRLSRSISDAGWGNFLRILRYKAEEVGCLIVTADRLYPSSQRCSGCGKINPALKGLAIRHWTCPKCGLVHDRDINAAINLIPHEDQIARAKAQLLTEQAERAKARQSQKDRTQKAIVTKLAKSVAKAAENAATQSTKLVARTHRETRNARRGPVRPKGMTTVVPTVARTVTPLWREEARTEPPGLLTILVSGGHSSLGALISPAPLPDESALKRY